MDDGKDAQEQGAQEQLKRFQETARALGCDEDEAAFDEKLKAIARQKPKDDPKQGGDAKQPGQARARSARSS